MAHEFFVSLEKASIIFRLQKNNFISCAISRALHAVNREQEWNVMRRYRPVPSLSLSPGRIPPTACEFRAERLPAVIHGYDDPIDK